MLCMLDEPLYNSSSIVAIHESMSVGCNSDDKKLNPFAGHTPTHHSPTHNFQIWHSVVASFKETVQKLHDYNTLASVNYKSFYLTVLCVHCLTHERYLSLPRSIWEREGNHWIRINTNTSPYRIVTLHWSFCKTVLCTSTSTLITCCMQH